MSLPIELRSDFNAMALRTHARRTRDANQARRLLALASIYDGVQRSDAARIGGVGVQIIRDWVVRFNEQGPDGLIDRKAPGPTPRLCAEHRQALVALIEMGPNPEVDGVVRWRLVDLVQWVWQELKISVSEQTLSRELRGLGYRKLSARPRHHAQNPDAIVEYKKSFLPRWQKSQRALRAANA